MEIEAQGLIAEAARMKKDAERMVPNVNLSNATVPSAPPPKPKRGRPSNASKAPAENAVQ